MEVNKTKNYSEPLQKPISVALSIWFCSLVSLDSITCIEEKQFQRPHVFTLHSNLRVFHSQTTYKKFAFQSTILSTLEIIHSIF